MGCRLFQQATQIVEGGRRVKAWSCEDHVLLQNDMRKLPNIRARHRFFASRSLLWTTNIQKMCTERSLKNINLIHCTICLFSVPHFVVVEGEGGLEVLGVGVFKL